MQAKRLMTLSGCELVWALTVMAIAVDERSNERDNAFAIRR